MAEFFDLQDLYRICPGAAFENLICDYNMEKEFTNSVRIWTCSNSPWDIGRLEELSIWMFRMVGVRQRAKQ
jgi:hypothetical protein